MQKLVYVLTNESADVRTSSLAEANKFLSEHPKFKKSIVFEEEREPENPLTPKRAEMLKKYGRVV